MENDEIIARQAAKIFELEDQITCVKENLGTSESDLMECQNVITQIYGITGYAGHPLNLVEVIRERFKEKMSVRGSANSS